MNDSAMAAPDALCWWRLSWTISASGLRANSSPDDPALTADLLTAATGLRLGALALGLPLNILTTFVLCRCSLRRLWTTLLLEVTCLLGITSLLLEAVPELLTLLGGPDFELVHLYSVLCRLITFFQRLARASLACLVCHLAEDRLTALGTRLCRKKQHVASRNITRTRLLSLGLSLLLLASVHALLPAWYHLEPYPDQPLTRCGLIAAPHRLLALLLDLIALGGLPLLFNLAFAALLVAHLLTRADCLRAPPPADHWANKLAGSALVLFVTLHCPRLTHDLLLLATGPSLCGRDLALRQLFTAITQLYPALAPLLYTACSRFRRELIFTTCCSRYAMTVQPRDSVMVQNRC